MIIIQDTREKLPWNFASYDECEGQIVQKLDTGDYAIQDSKVIVIDRKHTPSELAINLGKYRERFRNELERMQEYRFRYVVCEFSYEKLLMFPKGSKLPKKLMRKVRARGPYLAKKIKALSEEFGVEFVFCEDRQASQTKAIKLLLEAIDDD